MNAALRNIKTEIYDECGLEISNYSNEPESTDYAACRFQLNGRSIICRNAKITPKKVGQFVTFWKRSQNGPIEPFQNSDPFDFFVVNVQLGSRSGQFVFPKSVLIQKAIISTAKKEGKRAFRVYPNWDQPKSKQAKRSQKWQLDYFFELEDSLGLERANRLYQK